MTKEEQLAKLMQLRELQAQREMLTHKSAPAPRAEASNELEQALDPGVPAHSVTGLIAGGPAASALPAEARVTTGENSMVGATAGVDQMGRRVANFALPKALQPAWATNEAIKERERLNEPLPTLPKMAGEQAVLSPLAGISAGASAATRGAGPLIRTMARVGAAGAEGGVGGTIAGNVDEPYDAASKGAMTNFALSLLAGGPGSRVLKGVVQKSADAQRLIKEVPELEGHLPIVNAADSEGISGLIKTLYAGGIPNLPGASGVLKRQSADAADVVRRSLAKEAIPPGTHPDLSGSTSDQMDHLRAAFDDAYDKTINLFKLDIPPELEGNLKAHLAASISPEDLSAGNTIPEIVQDKLAALFGGKVAAFSDGKPTIGGRNLMSALNEAGDEYPNLSGKERSVLPLARSSVLQQTFLDDPAIAARYKRDFQATREPYALFKSLNSAAGKNLKDKGDYSFSDLLDSARGNQRASDIGELGTSVFDKNPVNPNWQGRFTLAALGGAQLMHGGSILPGVGLGYGLTSKGAQRALLGDTDWQTAIQRALKQDPNAMAALGAIPRQAASDYEANQ